MSLSTYLKRLEYIDDLIRRKATGNPESLSKRLNLSRSQTMLLLREMKNHGFPIEYSRKLNSYFYTVEGKLVRNLFVKNTSNKDYGYATLKESEMKKVSGGQYFFNLIVESDYIRLKDWNFM